MKKLSMFMAMVMCATLALSGCGNSVSDDRAQAYASLSSMTNLEQDQVKDYKQRLTVAPDSAAIKSVLADAKAANDKVTSDNAKADKRLKEIEVAITGVKLVGTDDCANVTLIFNADKTWQISGENAKKCFSRTKTSTGASHATKMVARRIWISVIVKIPARPPIRLMYH